MPEDLELLDARFILQASKNKSYKKQVRQMLKTLACFLQDNSLVTRELLPDAEEIAEDFILRRSDLTDVGYEFYRSAEGQWFDAVDRGVSPSDTKILERSLRLIRNPIEPRINWDRGSYYLEIGSGSVELPGPIDQALLWKEKESVLVLLDSPELLLVVNWNGRVTHTFSPPEDFSFYYLNHHAILGVTVVCVSDELVDGWQDWQFRIDLENPRLERVSPSK